MTTQSDTAALADQKRSTGFKARLFSPTTLQKMLAFASLILLLIFFSFASPAFMTATLAASTRLICPAPIASVRRSSVKMIVFDFT